MTVPALDGAPHEVDKIRVDLADLTLRELSDVGQVLAPVSLVDAIQGPQMADALAALAWIVRRRDVPEFTLEDAFALKMGDIELANPGAADPGKVSGVNDGAMPPTLLESGG